MNIFLKRKKENQVKERKKKLILSIMPQHTGALSIRCTAKISPMSRKPTTSQEEVRQFIVRSILSGELNDGDFLPSSREIESSLGSHCQTTSKVYKTLKGQGIVECVRGKGMVLLSGGTEKLIALEKERLDQALADIVRNAEVLGLSTISLIAKIGRLARSADEVRADQFSLARP